MARRHEAGGRSGFCGSQRDRTSPQGRSPDAQRYCWVLCSGAAWRDIPERFGPWSTVYQRFRHWRDGGTFALFLERLHLQLKQKGLINLDTWLIDSTAVRATRAASGAGKKGARRAGRPCTGLDHQDPPGLR